MNHTDWAACPDAERIAGKVSGAWLVKGSRVRVEDLLLNAEDLTAEQIVAEVYPSLPLDQVKRVIAFARHGIHATSA
jgi:uncharacterized protein (DUF433 family)